MTGTPKVMRRRKNAKKITGGPKPQTRRKKRTGSPKESRGSFKKHAESPKENRRLSDAAKLSTSKHTKHQYT